MFPVNIGRTLHFFTREHCQVSDYGLKRPYMRKEMDVLRFLETVGISLPAHPAKCKSPRILSRELIPEIIPGVSCFSVMSLAAGGPTGTRTFELNRWSEFRPIGGAGNNLRKPDSNATPGSPELASTEYLNIVDTDYSPVL